VEANVRWLQQQYQDRIVRAELHLDEATPHIHAYLGVADQSQNPGTEGDISCEKLLYFNEIG
jgi:hypothetical protein